MAVTGSLTVFITDKTLLMKAKNSEELSLDLSFAIDEGNKLTFSVPEVQLSYNGPTVDGPTGIKMDQSFSAYNLKGKHHAYRYSFRSGLHREPA